jgi:hypothetical protein
LEESDQERDEIDQGLGVSDQELEESDQERDEIDQGLVESDQKLEGSNKGLGISDQELRGWVCSIIEPFPRFLPNCRETLFRWRKQKIQRRRVNT